MTGGWLDDAPIDRSEHELADWELLTDSLVGAWRRRPDQRRRVAPRDREHAGRVVTNGPRTTSAGCSRRDDPDREGRILARRARRGASAREVRGSASGCGCGPGARRPPPHARLRRREDRTVERVHGAFTNPETRAYGEDGPPRIRCISSGSISWIVRATTAGRRRDRMYVDVFEHWLEEGCVSEHDHDDHDHPHAPVTDGDEPPAAARARALEELLVEKGVLVSREDAREGIDWLVSRTPADGARLVARAWVDPDFKGRLLADARCGRARARPRPGPVARAWSPSRTPTPSITWSCARCAPAIRGRCSGRRRRGTRAFPTGRARSRIRAACSASSGSSSTTTSSCGCWTRLPTSAIS